MEIYLLRHAEAEERREGVEDKDRPLTSLGAATISNLAKSLKKKIDKFDLILTSPLLRARQTADIVGNIFKNKNRIRESEGLLIGTPPSQLLDEIKKKKDLKRILIVGHQPHLGICISFLTKEGAENIAMKKGNCALVDIDMLKEGAGRLIWIKAPSEFKR